MDPAISSTDDARAVVATAGSAELGKLAGQTPFVGRGPELQEGLAFLDDVLAGRGRLLLLAGEPGIGKSRLADELSARARESGGRSVHRVRLTRGLPGVGTSGLPVALRRTWRVRHDE